MNEEDAPNKPLEKAETDFGWMVNCPQEFAGLYGSEAVNQLRKPWSQRVLEKKNNQLENPPVVDFSSTVLGDTNTDDSLWLLWCCTGPEEDLPVVLPTDIEFGQGNPLESSEEFLNVECPKCGAPARRETDTMDTFVDSSWYFLRYIDALNEEKCFEPELVNHFMNVDFIVAELKHAQMHLIYARFYTKALAIWGCILLMNRSKNCCAKEWLTLRHVV